jgi:hypothetical protein
VGASVSSGGARARSGPAPDRNAIRNGRAGADWIRLPASGRKGAPPAFPLSRPTARELALWAQEWRRPQAIMWEANGQELEVALYVRAVRIAEGAKAKVGDRNLVPRLQEALGLSQPGLARNHWIIDSGDPAGEAPEDGGKRPVPISTARERLARLREGRDAV